MKNKLLILTIIILLLNISIINAVDNKAVAYYESVSDAEKTVKILFHSWGEGLTTTIDLDNYFPVKRDANTQYLYISPPEIIVSIDQATGIATLKESKDWIGTKEVYFSIYDIYHLYEGQTSLQKYVEKIKKERESETIKTQIREFEDSSVYPYLNSLLDKLEKEKGSSEIPEIKATFKKPHLEIGVGDSINFDIGVQTKTKEGIKTYRPYLILNIKPEKQITELEEGGGFSIWILAPLFIILLVLAIMLYFYIKDNLPSIKRFINKIIPTKKKTAVDILTQDVKALKSFSLELKKLSNQLNKLPENNLSEQYFNIAKKFFNSLTHPSYEFTYAEITKEILEEDLSDDLKNQLLDFSKELSDLRFSGERITKPEIKDLIEKTQLFIDKAIKDKQKIRIKEGIKLIQKSKFLKFFNFIKYFFKEEEIKKESWFKKTLRNLGLYKTKREEIREIKKRKGLELKKEAEKRKERINIIKNILHSIGLFKTEAEKLKEKEEKKKIELEKKKLRLEKRKAHEKEIKGFEKLIKKVLHDNLGLFKTLEEKKIELQRKRELILKKKREEEKKRIEKLKESKIREKLKLEKQKERKEKVKKFFHDNLGLFKTPEEKKEERIERRIKKIEIKKKIKKNISEKINSFFRFIIKKRKLTAAEELQLLMKQEREALASKDTKKAHEIDKKINILYKEIQKKPSLISKELHQTYQRLKNEFNLVKQKISETKVIELKPKITFLDKFKKIFSQEIEKTKIDEIKFLIKKIEDQFELKAPDAKKISEYFLRANALYQKLNKISKNIISQELFKIKNKMGIIAIRSALEKAEAALKENQLKKAEEIYNKLTKTYYELPSKEREELHEKRAILQEKLKPSQHLIQKQQEKPKKLFQFSLFRIKKPLFKSPIQSDIKKIKERVTETLEEKKPFKKEFEVKEKLSDYLTAKKPSFPSIQTFLVKKETENKQVIQILKLIANINNYLSKKQHEKAKEMYLEAIRLFKELPEDIKPEIRDNIYHKLLPLKAQILDLSLHNSLQKAKEAVIAGKVKDAREHHEIASKIYTHLATNTDVFIPGPITLKEKQLDDLIKNANELIKNNKTKELKGIYTKIIELYNEFPPFKKQAYYNKISVIYNELLKK